MVWSKLVEEEEARAVRFGVDMESRNDLCLDWMSNMRKSWERWRGKHCRIQHRARFSSKARAPQTPGLLLADSTLLSNSSKGLGWRRPRPFPGPPLADDWLTSWYKHWSSPGLSLWASFLYLLPRWCHSVSWPLATTWDSHDESPESQSAHPVPPTGCLRPCKACSAA